MSDLTSAVLEYAETLLRREFDPLKLDQPQERQNFDVALFLWFREEVERRNRRRLPGRHRPRASLEPLRHHLARMIERAREKALAQLGQQQALSPTDATVPPAGKNEPPPTDSMDGKSAVRKRMSVDEANKKAMELAKKFGKGFFAWSEREQAKRIGCSWTTWKKTEFYQTVKAKRRTGNERKPSSPKTVSLTSKLEVVTGEGEPEEALQKLIAEQKADKEPSPLESDAPDRPRKIHFRKRL